MIPVIRSLAAGLAMVFLLPAAPVRAAEAAQSGWCEAVTACEFQLYIENDVLAGTDRYYTNGIKFGGGMRADPLIELLFQAPAQEVLRRIDNTPRKVHVGLFIGQQLYTPRHITVARPQPFDRPWAAWAYVGGVAQSVAENRMRTVELDLGVVGPAALGEPVQTEWHKLIGADRPRGWDNQLRNEPGILLTVLQKWRHGPANGWQIVPHAGASVGNVMTLARAGATLRFGRNMYGFGPDTIEPGGAMLQPSRREDDPEGSSKAEWYVFAGIDARAIAHNIFLDGSLLRAGPSVDRRVFVHDLKAGFSVRIAHARVSFTHTRRSDEFTTAAGRGGTQRFHSFNVGWEF